MDAGVIIAAIGTATMVAGVVCGAFLYVTRGEIRQEVTRLDGRINAHEEGCEERQHKLDERHSVMTDMLKELRHGQAEANKKLDSLVGFRP